MTSKQRLLLAVGALGILLMAATAPIEHTPRFPPTTHPRSWGPSGDVALLLATVTLLALIARSVNRDATMTPGNRRGAIACLGLFAAIRTVDTVLLFTADPTEVRVSHAISIVEAATLYGFMFFFVTRGARARPTG